MADIPTNNIVNLRTAKGITKYRASVLAGMSQTHWQKIESGEVAVPRLDTARKVAAALDATLDEVWPVESA